MFTTILFSTMGRYLGVKLALFRNLWEQLGGAVCTNCTASLSESGTTLYVFSNKDLSRCVYD